MKSVVPWRLLLAFAVLLGALSSAWKLGWVQFVRPNEAWPIRGVDVSHHQGPIDWVQVRDAGWRFAWLKATEGGDWVDPRFEENRDGARAAGLPWGAYHFFTFCRPARDQADNFLKTLGADAGQLPPVLDVEFGGNCSKRPTPQELKPEIAIWMDIVEAALGRDVVLYLTRPQREKLFGAGALPRRVWLRSIFSTPPPDPDMVAWQYHARGRTDGVEGFIDLNAFAGDEAAFVRFVGGP